MSIIRITKEFSFEMSHLLEGYDGLCSQIHGHSYRLFVTIIGTPSADLADPKNGMVMDFGLLKQLVNATIVSRFDHSLVIRRSETLAPLIGTLQQNFNRIIVTDYQPTCENMAADFAAQLSAQLPAAVALHSLRLHETATSFAEWFAADQPGQIK